MKSIRIALVATTAFALTGFNAQSTSGSNGNEEVACPAIACSSDNPRNPLCGTNGATYPNACELSLAINCSGSKKLALAYKGACKTNGTASPNATNEALPTAPKVPAPAPPSAKSSATSLVAVRASALAAVAIAATI